MLTHAEFEALRPWDVLVAEKTYSDGPRIFFHQGDILTVIRPGHPVRLGIKVTECSENAHLRLNRNPARLSAYGVCRFCSKVVKRQGGQS